MTEGSKHACEIAMLVQLSSVAWANLKPQGKISFIKRDDECSEQRRNDDSIV